MVVDAPFASGALSACLGALYGGRSLDRALSILSAGETAAAPPSPVGLKEASLGLIRLDVARTFPQLGLFQTVGAFAGAVLYIRSMRVRGIS